MTLSQAATAQASKPKKPCHCKAYKFPHRLFSGKCFAVDGAPYCGACGKSCTVTVSDEGYGAYEFWGRTGVHSHMVASSDCCGAEVYDDADLTETYRYEPDDDY